jgi:hypothetical protein
MVIEGGGAAIETNGEGFAVPTVVAIVGKTAWVSEGQLSYLFDASKKDTSPNLPFHIFPVALPD